MYFFTFAPNVELKVEQPAWQGEKNDCCAWQIGENGVFSGQWQSELQSFMNLKKYKLKIISIFFIKQHTPGKMD
jgi:hypothetical protein